ncbi:MAG TPA: hypothetical protein VHF46_05870 [Rubrobacteraceae bacterium]|nr:hypothetical protein [Rubrobacteraceae bacterium]
MTQREIEAILLLLDGTIRLRDEGLLKVAAGTTIEEYLRRPWCSAGPCSRISTLRSRLWGLA